MSKVDQAAEPTIGRLVADASRDISTLVQSEIALAKSEVKVSVKTGGIGAAMLAATAVLGLIIVVLLSVTLGYFIAWIFDRDVPLSYTWGFLVVSLVWTVIAALLAFVGIKKLKRVRAPERTISTAKEIPAALKGNNPTGHAALKAPTVR